jgi:hypothetical protein
VVGDEEQRAAAPSTHERTARTSSAVNAGTIGRAHDRTLGSPIAFAITRTAAGASDAAENGARSGATR